MYMVKSRINSNIVYSELKGIHPDDRNLESSTYNIIVGGGREVVVAFGKARHEHDGKGVVYYPMYNVDVKGNKTAGKIGFVEFPIDKIASVIDDEGDIEPDALDNPLLCDYADDDYFRSLDPVEEFPVDVLVDDNLSIFDVSEEQVLKPVDEPLFKIDMNVRQPLTLIEEDKPTADKLKSEYVESPKNEWIERYMKNNKYAIHPGSDCIFSVVRDAFAQIGQMITVEKLRDVLAGELTDEVYQKYRGALLTIESEIHDGERRIKTLHASLKELKKRVKKVSDKTDHELIIQQAKRQDADMKSIKQLNETYKKLAKDQFGFVENLDTFEKFQDCIRTTGCCVDKWAFQLLERKLNIKLIMLSESAFSDDSHDSVLECGASGPRAPNFYIIVARKGSRYRLVSYMEKRILTYREIPYDVRMLIVNKCKERNSAGFDLIQDFRNLKTKYGAPLDYANDYSENDAVFQFYDKAPNSAFPGMGSGETIPLDQLHNYLELNKTEQWRRKLDDMWSQSPLTLDGKQWSSVEHYYQGAKYKKGHPDDVYMLFSLNSGSDLSKDPYLARIVGSKEPHKLKTNGAVIDPDFYGGRNLIERDLAIQAKFEQNPGLLKLLGDTRSSKLYRFRRGNKPEEHTFLLKLRSDLCNKIT